MVDKLVWNWLGNVPIYCIYHYIIIVHLMGSSCTHEDHIEGYIPKANTSIMGRKISFRNVTQMLRNMLIGTAA